MAPRKRTRKPKPLRVVITAGPTREYLDDIRFLSNASTGRMGMELARVAALRGDDVHLVLGPTQLAPPKGCAVTRVVSTQDLLVATREQVEGADLVIFSAAPSDYRPRRRRKGKPPREAGDLTLDLVATPDVAATLGRNKGTRIHVGFALEVKRGTGRAMKKLRKKRLDAIVLNDPTNFGIGGGRARWVSRDEAPEELPAAKKGFLARAILREADKLLGR
jgi:phosphopantothenoylcysteine decarboxylase/phosphopantothenate--cysteine ligase